MSSETPPINQVEKPFWLRPPLAILFDLIRLQRVRPWDVNLSFLLTTLIGEMRRRGNIDFTASGLALLSSATIYRMKSELILDLQEPPPPPEEKLIEFVPPPVQLPFRYEYTTTSIDNLVKALEQAMKEESVVVLQPRLIPITPPPPLMQEVDEFMVDIEDKVEDMFQKLSKLGDTVISFTKLTLGLRRLEVIRAFLLILFLACRGRIQLWQEENSEEIYISMKSDALDVSGSGQV